MNTDDSPTADQAWFWTEEWQAGEAEADAQIAAEPLPVYDDMHVLLAELDATPERYIPEPYDPGDYCGTCGIAWSRHAEDCRIGDLL